MIEKIFRFLMKVFSSKQRVKVVIIGRGKARQNKFISNHIVHTSHSLGYLELNKRNSKIPINHRVYQVIPLFSDGQSFLPHLAFPRNLSRFVIIKLDEMLTEFKRLSSMMVWRTSFNEVDQEIEVVVACQANAEGLICLGGGGARVQFLQAITFGI